MNYNLLHYMHFIFPQMFYRGLEWEFVNLTEYASALGYSFCPKMPFDQWMGSLRTKAMPKSLFPNHNYFLKDISFPVASLFEEVKQNSALKAPKN